MRFSELGELPVFLELERLDEGSGIETTLINNKAVWHKLCYNNFNTTKLQRAEKRVIASDSEQENGPAKKYRCRSSFQEMPKDCCFFCGEGPLESLHEAATMHLDSRVRKCAQDLQDESLLAKLSVGDMVAIDAKYHLQCLVSLYNRASALSTTRKTDESRKVNEGIALAELLAYMDEMRMNADVAPIFKLSDLVKLYSSRLEYLGVEQHVRPHSTELKNRILAHIPELKAYKEGREVLLAFDSDMGYAIHKFCDEDYDSEAICLAKAAKIVRRDMLELRAMFTGSFDQDCQQKSVPKSLLALVDMIHNGPNIADHNSPNMSQATLSIAQLLQYNTFARRRPGSNAIYHMKGRETPLPIYMGLTLHAKTRKRDLVDTLFSLGLSISYDRVLEISTAMNNRVCELYMSDNVVCPPNLREGLFCTAAVDNIDHDPSSTTSTESFHGTGISLFQYPTIDEQGHDRRQLSYVTDELLANKTLLEFPESYTNVKPLLLTKKDVDIPKANFLIESQVDSQVFLQAVQKENK